jgi:two-component system, OmpR family, sensor histidine kinase KdpD
MSFAQQYIRPLLSVLVIVGVTFTGYQLHFNAATAVLLCLLIIVWQSLGNRFPASVFVSLVAAACLDFFFFPPLLSLRIADPFNVLAFVVFVIVALVITRLVSRLRAEAETIRRRNLNLEQLYEVSRRLLLSKPDCINGGLLVQTLRDAFLPSAVCLFDAESAEMYLGGTPAGDLVERTRQAYFQNSDADNPAAGVVLRRLRTGDVTRGAIGIEGLRDAGRIIGSLSVLVAAAMEQARVFRKSRDETAATQVEIFRTAVLDALAHEFKTPLATILAVVGGLRESQRLGTQEIEMAGMVEFEASRLNNLTDRLVRMARLDREEVKPRMRNTDIAAFVERMVHRYTAQSRDRQVAVSCECQPAEAQADRQLLELALTQLLDNAFKYSIPGSAVAVEIGVETGFITIRVRNEGSWIAPQEQDRIFERFYRGSGVRNLVTGAGLGLYVARKIAVAQGGSLDLDKNASPGTVVFRLNLPAVNPNGNLHVSAENSSLSRR